MTRPAAILALLLALPAAAQQVKPGDLVPVEQGTADTSVMGTTLRIMPVELNESTNFRRLYGVAGRPDLLVRSHGGMYGVFDQGQYVTWKNSTYAVWPSGTQFFIGRPDFSRLRTSPMRQSVDAGMQPAPGIRVATRVPEAPSPAGPNLRIDRRPDALPDARVPDARMPDARVGAAPIRAGQGAPPPGARQESHAVPDAARATDQPSQRVQPGAAPGEAGSNAPAPQPSPRAEPGASGGATP
jgi:hypothetical protein